MNKYVSLEDVAKMALSMMGISNTEWVQALQGLPTINIVQCKECCNHKTEDCAMAWWDSHWGEYLYPDDDNFCSYGDKR